MTISEQPATQQEPIPRATTAAWEVIPPRAVRMPCADFMPSMSSGEVSRRTRTTFSPLAAHSLDSSAVKTILPEAAPGAAGRPWPMSLPSASAAFRAFGSKEPWRRVSRFLGSMARSAFSLVVLPSLTRSTAILMAARAVRLPLRHWSMKSLPSSMVNSMSCMSQ